MAIEKLPVGGGKTAKAGHTHVSTPETPDSDVVTALAIIQIHGLALAILGSIYLSFLHGGPNPNMMYQILAIMTIVLGVFRIGFGFYTLRRLVKAKLRRPDVEQNGKVIVKGDVLDWLKGSLFSISSVGVITLLVGLLLTEAYKVDVDVGMRIVIWIIIFCGIEVGLVLIFVFLVFYIFLLVAC